MWLPKGGRGSCRAGLSSTPRLGRSLALPGTVERAIAAQEASQSEINSPKPLPPLARRKFNHFAALWTLVAAFEACQIVVAVLAAGVLAFLNPYALHPLAEHCNYREN